MSATAILEKVSTTAKRRAEMDDQAYTQLVQRCGRDQEIDPDKVLIALNKWGRDLDQFQADVEAFATRLELVDVAATAPDLEIRLEEVRLEIDQLDRELEAAIEAASRKRDAAVMPLLDEQRQKTIALDRARAAKSKLIAECTDPHRLATVKATQTRLQDSQDRLSQLIAVAEQLPYAIRTLEAQFTESIKTLSSLGSHASTEWRDCQLPGAEAEHESLKSRIATLKADLETAPSRIAAARREVDQAHVELEIARTALTEA